MAERAAVTWRSERRGAAEGGSEGEREGGQRSLMADRKPPGS